MSNLRDEIDEILRNKIEIQFPESLAPNPVVIYGEAFEALTALFNKHVEEWLPEYRTDETHPIDEWLEQHPHVSPNLSHEARLQVAASRMMGYNQALDDIKAKLKE